MSNASPNISLWHSLVDEYASIGDGVFHNWIVERAKYPDFDENREFNELLAALSRTQREVLARMMIDAHQDGVFDSLARLHDRLALNNGKYYENGVEMAFEPHGNKLYEDYISRKMGYEWPG